MRSIGRNLAGLANLIGAIVVLFGIGVVVLIIVAVYGGSSSAPSTSAAPDGGSREIARATFRGTWPFTVPAGTLRCIPPQSVTFTVGTTVYGVNGTAMDSGLPAVDPIWAKEPASSYTPRKDLGAVIDQGLALCNGNGSR